jgi:hypothetical protein
VSDIEDLVDEIVDDMDPLRIDRVLEQTELTLRELMTRVENELKARLDP